MTRDDDITTTVDGAAAYARLHSDVDVCADRPDPADWLEPEPDDTDLCFVCLRPLLDGCEHHPKEHRP